MYLGCLFSLVTNPRALFILLILKVAVFLILIDLSFNYLGSFDYLDSFNYLGSNNPKLTLFSFWTDKMTAFIGLPFLDGLPLPLRVTLSLSFSISFLSFLLLGFSGSGSAISYFFLFPLPMFISNFWTFSAFYNFSNLTTFSNFPAKAFCKFKGFSDFWTFSNFSGFFDLLKSYFLTSLISIVFGKLTKTFLVYITFYSLSFSIFFCYFLAAGWCSSC